jgi:aminopeptidase N
MIATSLPVSKSIVQSLLLAFAFSASAAPVIVQHDLAVELDPARGQLKVSDRIRLPEGLAGADRTIDFFLNAAFEPSLGDTRARLELLAAATPKRVRGYRVHLASDSPTLTIMYTGKLAQSEGAYEFGHIGPEGVFLTETSAWYPLFEDALVTFSMQVRAPGGWTAISQGADDSLPPDSERAMHLWREARPQTEIVLLAGRFIAYASRTADLDARVYLRSPDAALAERYLEATAHYVQLYAQLLGPYPYDKFALVENFWETGYGLPSLALLGPRVIRFPFILHSSFPHEILHNWWGNGVYLSSAGGNWSEGLTAYLADHLVQEQRGRGADHRRSALQKYASYVAAADDFPLSEFRGRHGEVSQAVGYNKALMFFHMLRQRLGDANFLEGLRLFAARYRFQPAGYDGLRRAFESVSGAELSFEFEQWVERTGAPSLRLSNVNVENAGDGYRLKGVVAQQQPGAPYRLRVPVVVQLEGRAQALRDVISMETTRAEFVLELPLRPTALHVDPEFDLFRRLGPGEAPASLGDLLGAKDALFVLPAGDTAGRKAAHTALAGALGGGQTVDDTARLPAGKSVWLLGWNNAHLDVLARSVAADGVVFSAEGVRLGTDVFQRDAACAVIAARTANDSAQSIGFIGCDNTNAFAGLARKIPHYGKYGFLAFAGDEPVNVRKDEWPVRNSPMTIVFNPQSAQFPPPLPQRSSLAAKP